MSKKCCVPFCRVQKDDPGCLNLHFVSVPNNDDIRKEWSDVIENYCNKKVEFKKYSYVCSQHFEPECFNMGALCKNLRLKKGSRPTIFVNNFSKKSQVLFIKQDDEIQHFSDTSNDAVHISPSVPTSLLSSSISNVSAHVSISNKGESYEDNVEGRALNYTEFSQSDICNDINLQDFDGSSADFKSVPKKVDKTILNKSLVNINIEDIDYQNKSMVKKILLNAQAEIRTLRRTTRNQSMRLYRAKKKVKNGSLLISHMKKRKLISEELSEILEVNMNNE